MSRIPAPPRLAERVLEWCLRRSPTATFLLGDLRHEFATLARTRSHLHALVWYWTQILEIGLRYAFVGYSSGSGTNRGRTGGVGQFLEIVVQDIALAFRGMRGRPGFAGAVVLTLGLGIGANATMFGVVDRVLLSPPEHVQDAGRLRILALSGLGQRSLNSPLAYSFPDYQSIADHPLLAGAAVYRPPSSETLDAASGGADARKVVIQPTTATFFPLLGVSPARGRFYSATDDRVGAPLTAVISHDFWEGEYGADPAALGRTLRLGRGTYEVIGVAPKGFTGAELKSVDVWVPVQAYVPVENGWTVLESRGAWWWRVIVRLGDDVRDEDVARQLTAAHMAGIDAYLEGGGERVSDSMGGQIHLGSIITAVGPNASTATSVALSLAGVSLLVLLIACANVANLFLARGIQLRRDRAVRLALGVSRLRLMGQSLTEALVLSGVGALAALAVARWSASAVYALLLPGFAPADVGIDFRFVAFLMVLALFTAILAGLLPALSSSWAAPADVLRNSARGNTGAGSRTRSLLTAGQVTLSVVLLVGAGLFIKSLTMAGEAKLGFDFDRILVVQIESRAGVDRTQRNQVYAEALSRITALAGVESAVLSSETIPMWGYNEQYGMVVSTTDSVPRIEGGGPYTYSGTEGFVETYGMNVVQGRSFAPGEYRTGAAPVVMVSRSFARRIWPGLDPLDECVTLEAGPIKLDTPEPCRSVVGVYDDIAVRSLSDGGTLSVAWPTPPETNRLGGVVVRAAGDPSALVGPLRALVAGLSSDVRYVRVNPLGQQVDRLMGPWRVGAAMFTAFGVLALLVASLGLYSVLAFGVARRKRELGIRAALGARRQDLIRMIMRQAFRLVIGGLVAGAAVVVVAGRILDSVLFGVTAKDPMVFGLVAATLLGAGLFAALVPAWNATTIDPAATMQAD